MSRADFSYTIEDGVVCIVDWDNGNMSVTNDMENVLADIEMAEGPIAHHKIIYRDSEGVWDEVTGWPNRVGFVSIGAKTKDEALARVRGV